MKKANTGVLAIDAPIAAGLVRRPKLKMRRFRIDEISVVDMPAQEGALMTLLKRADPVELETYNKWMGSGAKEVSEGDGGEVTLELKGERRTFFKTEPEPFTKATEPELDTFDPSTLTPEQRQKLHGFMEAHGRHMDRLLTKYGGTREGGTFMSKHDELAKAIAKHLEAEEAANTAPTEAERRAAVIVAKIREEQSEGFDDKAALAFEKRVNEIKKRDKISSRMAMEQAAIEFPQEYEEWQTGAPGDA